MRRIVLPLTEVGIGGETIAKILFCPGFAEPESRLRPGIGIHEEYLPVAEGEIARRLEPLLNRGLLIRRQYCQSLAHSYRLDVRFFGTTYEVIWTPSFGRAITSAFRPVGWRLQRE
jgi:hypothetical protein